MAHLATDLFVSLALLAGLAAPAATQSLLTTHADSSLHQGGGQSLASIGDVDGDGAGDLLIGVPQAVVATHDDVGRVELRSGRTGALIRQWTGDVPGERFGSAVCALPDISGDGVPEVVASSPRWATAGAYDRVRVFDGASGAVLHTFTTLSNDDLGTCLAAADMDGDGWHELIVGAPHGTVGGPGHTNLVAAGYLMRYEFLPLGAVLKVVLAKGTTTNERVGNRVVVYDLDGDGRDDVLTAALPGFGQTIPPHARAYDVDGNLLNTYWLTGDLSLGVAGDVDLDGLVDGLIGSYQWDSLKGRVDVWRSGSQPLSLLGVTDSAGFGSAVAGVGDHDGDGIPDVLAGSFYMGVPAAHGRASLHSGTDLGLLWSHDGDNYYGTTVTAIDDLDLDGTADFAVGAPGLTQGGAAGQGHVDVWTLRDADAQVDVVGPGLPGTLGVPLLTAGIPQLGEAANVTFRNSVGASTIAVLHLGFVEAALPFKGGTLYTDPLLNLFIPLLPDPGLTLPLEVPYDTWLCGVQLILQGSQLDAGAIVGVSLTRGLRLTLGA